MMEVKFPTKPSAMFPLVFVLPLALVITTVLLVPTVKLMDLASLALATMIAVSLMEERSLDNPSVYLEVSAVLAVLTQIALLLFQTAVLTDSATIAVLLETRVAAKMVPLWALETVNNVAMSKSVCVSTIVLSMSTVPTHAYLTVTYRRVVVWSARIAHTVLTLTGEVLKLSLYSVRQRLVCVFPDAYMISIVEETFLLVIPTRALAWRVITMEVVVALAILGLLLLPQLSLLYLAFAWCS